MFAVCVLACVRKIYYITVTCEPLENCSAMQAYLHQLWLRRFGLAFTDQERVHVTVNLQLHSCESLDSYCGEQGMC